MYLDNPIGTYVFLALCALSAIGICVAVYRYFWGKTVFCRATLVDKYEAHYQSVGSTGGHMGAQYVLVFDLEGKIKKFTVSVWLYDSVQKGETCRITCRNGRLISID